DIAEIALAECVCGAPDRDVATRLSGSRPDLWRSAFAACSDHLLDLLQRGAHASRIVQGYAPAPTCPAIRLYRRRANPVRPTPSLCEDMIFGRDTCIGLHSQNAELRRGRRLLSPGPVFDSRFLHRRRGGGATSATRQSAISAPQSWLPLHTRWRTHRVLRRPRLKA